MTHICWHFWGKKNKKNFLSSPLQPSLLSAEPLLPPHNFHSHSLRRLPLYQPMHISQPMPVSLSVGQPILPPLPAHHKVLPSHTSLSPPRVPPFLSLPRQQPSYRLDQVCLDTCWWTGAFIFVRFPLHVHSRVHKLWVLVCFKSSYLEFIFVDHSSRRTIYKSWAFKYKLHLL